MNRKSAIEPRTRGLVVLLLHKYMYNIHLDVLAMILASTIAVKYVSRDRCYGCCFDAFQGETGMEILSKDASQHCWSANAMRNLLVDKPR